MKLVGDRLHVSGRDDKKQVVVFALTAEQE